MKKKFENLYENVQFENECNIRSLNGRRYVLNRYAYLATDNSYSDNKKYTVAYHKGYDVRIFAADTEGNFYKTDEGTMIDKETLLLCVNDFIKSVGRKKKMTLNEYNKLAVYP